MERSLKITFKTSEVLLIKTFTQLYYDGGKISMQTKMAYHTGNIASFSTCRGSTP